jgi:hypothetical protein
VRGPLDRQPDALGSGEHLGASSGAELPRDPRARSLLFPWCSNANFKLPMWGSARRYVLFHRTWDGARFDPRGTRDIRVNPHACLGVV